MGSYPWGGSEELWSKTALSLKNAGLEVAINYKKWPISSSQLQNLKSHQCKIFLRDENSIFFKADRLLSSNFFRYRWIDEFKPDLVLISQGGNQDGIEWAELCLRKKIPYMLLVEAANEGYWPDDNFANRLRIVYQKAKKTFFVSQGNLKLTEVQIATKLNNAQIVYNPFNVSYDTKIPWPIDNKKYKLACVARLDPVNKGQDILLEIFAKPFWKSLPIELNLYGYGRNEKSFKKLKKDWQLKNIYFKGFEPDVKKIWQDNHALVLPSRSEGLPLVLVEAMICARPSIVTDVAGNSELIKDNVNGFLAQAPNVKIFEETLLRAWNQRKRWKEIGQQASKDVRTVIPEDPITYFINKMFS